MRSPFDESPMVKRPRSVPLFSNVLDAEKVAMVRKLVAVLMRGQKGAGPIQREMARAGGWGFVVGKASLR